MQKYVKDTTFTDKFILFDEKDFDALKARCVDLCVACGSCTFACPAKRPVAQNMGLAKAWYMGELRKGGK